MRPFYDARIGDLGPADYLKLECLGCKHKGVVSGERLRVELHTLPVTTLIRDLHRRFKCRECKAKGRVDISIDWAR
jgi:hypothetical protein